MEQQIVIVGGGMAGLTAAAYLCKSGCKVLLCEKEAETGGLVNSFAVDGFTFDGGIRAIEDSGIVQPMLRQLGLDIPFTGNGVSIGIGHDVVNLQSDDSLQDYLALLSRHFPQNEPDIARFGAAMQQIMRYMDVLYGIDNPLFLDLKSNPRYLVKTILPWLLRYILTIRKIERLDEPVTDYLKRLTSNTALVDLIAQHFFRDTPAFFALSYFRLYLDYRYPCGGTGKLTERMKQFIVEHQGEIRCETEISRLDLSEKSVQDTHGNTYPFAKLVWCADQKRLYQAIDPETIKDPQVLQRINAYQASLTGKVGGDSILTLYLALDMDKSFFANIANAHFFYTPDKAGLGSLSADTPLPDAKQNGAPPDPREWQTLQGWLQRFFRLTTYEISCPVLRDDSLAPAGKTGLIISTLFDYPLVRHIADRRWYDDFKKACAQMIIAVLDATVYPGIGDKVLHQSVSTPLTIERITGNTDGAITGWAFTNQKIPAVHRMTQVAKATRTPVPDVCQAGQWTFSPSGLPISILTGKLAADQVLKELKP